MATPCWPAPVSAMTRVLPMRLVSSAWPSTLLILCEPVWLRSSRLRMMRAPPACSAKRGTSVMIDGRPGVAAVQLGELGLERGIGLGGLVRGGELVDRGDERLGHEAPAELAEEGSGRVAQAHASPMSGRQELLQRRDRVVAA